MRSRVAQHDVDGLCRASTRSENSLKRGCKDVDTGTVIDRRVNKDRKTINERRSRGVTAVQVDAVQGSDNAKVSVELIRLVQLRQLGLITEAEFETGKDRAFASLRTAFARQSLAESSVASPSRRR
jgi:hypothetical protein